MFLGFFSDDSMSNLHRSFADLVEDNPEKLKEFVPSCGERLIIKYSIPPMFPFCGVKVKMKDQISVRSEEIWGILHPFISY